MPKKDNPAKKTGGSFDEICKDLTPPKNGNDHTNMVYEVACFHTSGYVHSSPPSIQEIASRLSQSSAWRRGLPQLSPRLPCT